MYPRTSSQQATPTSEPVVLIVDDEPGMRSALVRTLRQAGLASEVYESGPALFEQARLDRPGCLLLDVRMPGMDGLEVQAELNRRAVALPTIFLTGAADVPVAVAAMRAGAADFIEKPFVEDRLLERVRQVIARSVQERSAQAEHRAAAACLASLTPREREVLELVVAGLTSKEIARELGASPRTIEIHRTHVMEKMHAATLADLVRVSVSLLPPASARA